MRYPAAAQQFLAYRTDHGVTLLTGPTAGIADVSYVASLLPTSDDELDMLLHALHEAAWSGERQNWEAIAPRLPLTVAHACENTLQHMPTSDLLLLDDDGEPVTVVQEILAHAPCSEELFIMLAAGYDLGLPVLAENYFDSSQAEPAVRLRVLSDGPSIWPDELERFWPSPLDATLLERKIIPPGQFKKNVTDPRWHSTYTRTYWVPMISPLYDHDDGNYSVTGLWVVEFFAHPIVPRIQE